MNLIGNFIKILVIISCVELFWTKMVIPRYLKKMKYLANQSLFNNIVSWLLITLGVWYFAGSEKPVMNGAVFGFIIFSYRMVNHPEFKMRNIGEIVTQLVFGAGLCGLTAGFVKFIEYSNLAGGRENFYANNVTDMDMY